MMTSSTTVIWCIIVFITPWSIGDCLDVEYAYKILSDHKGDNFAASLSTSFKEIVIGAPRDNKGRGSVMNNGIRLHPPQGNYFGNHVHSNKEFVVVVGHQPHTVYVYGSNSPDLKAMFPLKKLIADVVISDDNTIAVRTHLFLS